MEPLRGPGCGPHPRHYRGLPPDDLGCDPSCRSPVAGVDPVGELRGVLAARLGVSQARVARLESGTNSPQLDTADAD
ncbi:helix-turn-helix domain-containing protein [Streptomyces sp. NPDC002346]